MCLIRDRLISFGLRRQHRPQDADSEWVPIEETDFGMEIVYPKFVDIDHKMGMVKAFIWLCKLTDIMSKVAVFQDNNRYERKWSDDLVSRDFIRSESEEVVVFDKQLRSWKQEYQQTNSDFIHEVPAGRSVIFLYNMLVCE